MTKTHISGIGIPVNSSGDSTGFESLLNKAYKASQSGDNEYKPGVFYLNLDFTDASDELNYIKAIFKAQNQRLPEAKLKEANNILNFAKSLTINEWSQLGLTKPSGIDNWNARSKIDDLISLGVQINEAINLKSAQSIAQKVVDPEIVTSLKNKFGSYDTFEEPYFAKVNLIKDLTTEELITISKGYLDWLVKEKKIDISNSNSGHNVNSNFLRKDILLAEIAGSEFAVNYYIETIKVAVNALAD
ncbi:MAG: hypothetical protein QNJ31_04220 [Candidatus Caenarcaniphilales bacterium]|nr:hypothetical protein [Candidatus Caenarcaniphilales bacterium]